MLRKQATRSDKIWSSVSSWQTLSTSLTKKNPITSSENDAASNSMNDASHRFCFPSSSQQGCRNFPSKSIVNATQIHHLVARNTLSTSTTSPLSSSSMAMSSSSLSSASQSNMFWKELTIAARNGNGQLAEKIVDETLQEILSTTTATPHDAAKNVDNNGIGRAQTTLDSSIFSLVLQAWKNSNNTKIAIQRAPKILEQMIALADQGIITSMPTLDDFHSVLYCLENHTHFIHNNIHHRTHRFNNNNSEYDNSLDEFALQILEDMKNLHILPSESTYKQIFSIFANLGRGDLAIQLLEDDILERQNHYLIPTVEMCNLILQACAERSSNNRERRENGNNVDVDKGISSVEQTESFLLRMKQQKNDLPQPNTDSFNVFIGCLSKDSRNVESVHRAVDVLDEMKEYRVRPTLASYQPILRTFAKLGEGKQAEDLLTRLIKDYGAQFDAELKPSLENFQTVLEAYSKSYHPDAAPRAESVLTHMNELYQSRTMDTKPTLRSYELVMQCWSKSRRPDAAERARDLYNNLKADGLLPTGTAMNIFLNAVASNISSSSASSSSVSSPDMAEQLLFDLCDAAENDPMHNPQPDVISFSIVIKAWSKSNDPRAAERAEALIQKVERLYQSGIDECKPNVVLYSSAIQCWAKAAKRRPKKSKLVGQAKSSSYQQQYEGREAAKKAESYLRKLQQLEASSDGGSDMGPDTICWNLVLNAWAQAGDGKHAEELYEEMLTNYLQSKKDNEINNNDDNNSTYNDDGAYEDENDYIMLHQKEANDDGTSSSSTTSNHPAPNAITYTAVLSALAKSRNYPQASERAERLIKHMDQLHESGILPTNNNVKPNVATYSAVIDCLAYSKRKANALRAEQILRQMIASDDPYVQPNIVTYNSVIKAWSFIRNDPDSVKHVFQLLDEIVEKSQIDTNDTATATASGTSTSIRPTIMTFGSILKTIADSNISDKASKAQYVLSIMEQYGFYYDGNDDIDYHHDDDHDDIDHYHDHDDIDDHNDDRQNRRRQKQKQRQRQPLNTFTRQQLEKCFMSIQQKDQSQQEKNQRNDSNNRGRRRGGTGTTMRKNSTTRTTGSTGSTSRNYKHDDDVAGKGPRGKQRLGPPMTIPDIHQQ